MSSNSCHPTSSILFFHKCGFYISDCIRISEVIMARSTYPKPPWWHVVAHYSCPPWTLSRSFFPPVRFSRWNKVLLGFLVSIVHHILLTTTSVLTTIQISRTSGSGVAGWEPKMAPTLWSISKFLSPGPTIIVLHFLTVKFYTLVLHCIQSFLNSVSYRHVAIFLSTPLFLTAGFLLDVGFHPNA